ncbi:MAG: cobalamin biosynthesis protein CbiD [Eggerthellaceae bacterium]|nr:cobalamin biosynthesis protein CbiD [Eggerthellaceae bacterium]
MQQLDRYITSGGKRLRCGYTTGTCAAAATRAAAEMLLTGQFVPAVSVDTPAGIAVAIDVEEHSSGNGWAECAVRKDAGDDPDVTDGALVFARVSMREGEGVSIDGGVGVGRVTQAGLDQPVGAAAINSTPRAMIAEQAMAAAASAGYTGGLDVVVSIPAGIELAAHTFNPKLGIEGGISVLGTSGIVKPMSEDALVASIELELNVLREAGVDDLLVVPGNYGRDFAEGGMNLSLEKAVQCSNYLGATIDASALLGFRSMLIVGHIGKMAKVAGGIMNTHSRVADCRVEVLAAHAARCGASQGCVAQIMDALTTDAVIDLLAEEGMVEQTMQSLVHALEERLAHRAGGRIRTEAIVFSKVHGLLGKSSGALELATLHMPE